LVVIAEYNDASAAFAKLSRDAQGVRPVELYRFVCSRVPESDANEIFESVLWRRLKRERLTDQVGLPHDAITDRDFERLWHLLSLWYRWASDNADMAAWISGAHHNQRGEDR
jgi:hypothetical protein